MTLVRGLRSAVKYLVSATLHYTGLLHLLLRWRHTGHGLVLLYHRVLPEADSARSFSSDSIIVTPATFARHLRALRHHFTFVTPEAFEEWWRGTRTFDKPPCLISFDDGWRDNLDHAAPILRTEQAPAVIFLPTRYIGTGHVFWQERLSALLERLGRHSGLRTHPLVALLALEPVFHSVPDLRSQQAREVARRFKSSSPGDISTVLADVTELLHSLNETPEPSPVDAYLDWESVRVMQSGGIHFGSHAVTHRILTRLDPDETREELESSRRALEDRLHQPVRYLAYPNGDHDATTCRHAQEAGYALAFTTVPGWVKPGQDPYRLRRINIHEGAHRHTHALYASILGIF
jgi:peptidoglycan/xylan/chitin deacetylase (PgdA/CDA1 family)